SPSFVASSGQDCTMLAEPREARHAEFIAVISSSRAEARVVTTHGSVWIQTICSEMNRRPRPCGCAARSVSEFRGRSGFGRDAAERVGGLGDPSRPPMFLAAEPPQTRVKLSATEAERGGRARFVALRPRQRVDDGASFERGERLACDIAGGC